MSASNSSGSTRREDISMKLKLQNLRNTKNSSKMLEVESRKMEERLEELKMAMKREKDEREKRGGYWKSGRTGSLNSYAQNALITPTREGKKVTKVRVLKDEPLDIPEKENKPGTMSYIAHRGSDDGRKVKGHRCGQCDVKSANLTCMQCSELYCTACFQAFHSKGALRKHHSVPIKNTNAPRACMSSRSPPDSARSRESVNGAAGKDTEKAVHFEEPRNGHHHQHNHEEVGASGNVNNANAGLGTGVYDEAESAASFQAALKEWRNTGANEEPKATTNGHPFDGRMEQLPSERITPRQHNETYIPETVELVTHVQPEPVSYADHATSSNDLIPAIEINFHDGTSYADRLLLKQHRRADIPPLPIHTATANEEEMEEADVPLNHLDFDDMCATAMHAGMVDDEIPQRDIEYIVTDVSETSYLYLEMDKTADCTVNLAQSCVETAEDTSEPINYPEYIVTDVTDSAIGQSHMTDNTDPDQPEYIVTDVTEHFVGQSQNGHETNSVIGQEVNNTEPITNENLNEITETQNVVDNLKLDETSSNKKKNKNKHTPKNDANNTEAYTNEKSTSKSLNSARSSKSRPVSRAKSRNKTRSNSRAQSRASSRLSEYGPGLITKTTSHALHSVVAMATQITSHSYTHGIGDLFTPQTQNETPHTQNDKISSRESSGWSVSSLEMSESGFERPESGFGRPESAFGRPGSAFGRPGSAFGRPDSALGRPSSTTNKPKTGVIERVKSVKLSNRLYQMSPKSWKPDASLAEVLPLNTTIIDTQTLDDTLTIDDADVDDISDTAGCQIEAQDGGKSEAVTDSIDGSKYPRPPSSGKRRSSIQRRVSTPYKKKEKDPQRLDTTTDTNTSSRDTITANSTSSDTRNTTVHVKSVNRISSPDLNTDISQTQSPRIASPTIDSIASTDNISNRVPSPIPSTRIKSSSRRKVASPSPLVTEKVNTARSKQIATEKNKSSRSKQVISSRSEQVMSPLATEKVQSSRTKQVMSTRSTAERMMSPETTGERVMSPLSTVERVMSPLSTAERVMSPLTSGERVMSPLTTAERVMSPLSTAERVMSPLSTRVASPYLRHMARADSKLSRRPSAVCEVSASECYDDHNERLTDGDDAHTLEELEWELASQSGRITAEGHISRMDNLDDSFEEITEHLTDSDVTERISRLGRPVQGGDLTNNLRESELMEDFEEMERKIKEEEEEESVKALH